MYRIALVCENGASTGMVVKRMLAAAEKLGVEVEVKAYPYSQFPDVVATYDYALFGPQLKFRMDKAKQDHPVFADRISVISPMDFGMMNGEEILKAAIAAIDTLA